MSEHPLPTFSRLRRALPGGVLALLILVSFPHFMQAEAPRVQALRCGRLLDVRSGELLRDQVVIVKGDRIVAVGSASAVTVPPEAEWIDLSRETVLPGLIDCHTHLIDLPEDTGDIAYGLKKSAAQMAFQSIPSARATLLAGFTCVRDMGPRRAFVDVALRDAIEKGIVIGPRIQASGAYVTISGGAGDVTGFTPDVLDALPRELRFGVADGPDQVRQRVREIIRQGADVIKILSTGAVLTLHSLPGAQEFGYDEIKAAVEEASKAGLKVACHAHGPAGAEDAVRAGVASIEHGSLLDEEALQLIKKQGTFLVPTIYVHEVIMQQGPSWGYPAEYLEKERIAGEQEVKVFRRAVELGVRMAFGTDAAVCPHGDNARQFAVMVRHGMTPAAAIQSATIQAAELLGWADRTGSIEPGKWADIIAVRDNPLENVRALENVAFVMKGGHVFKNAGR
jgi:imidazolonepropionase-like amidohydrolase